MKPFLTRVEHAVIRVAVNPKLRPLENQLAVSVAKSVLLRTGAGVATSAVVLELVNHFFGL